MHQQFARSGSRIASDGIAGYRIGSVETCPDCGNSQWHVGRQSAECACCGIALPLAEQAVRRPLFTAPTPRTAWRAFMVLPLPA